MSHTTARLRQRTALGLLSLYPQPWRVRYREEMVALLEDDQPGIRGLASLLVGATDAHLRPQASWQSATSALVRIRLSIGAVFACWIALSVCGVGYQKTVENYEVAAERHPLLAVTHGVVLGGALFGAGVIAVGGLPLLWQSLGQAIRTRDRRLGAVLLSPAVAVMAFVGETVLLVTVAPAKDGGFPAGFVLSSGIPCLLGVLALALTCALAPRVSMRRVEPTRQALRGASQLAPALVRAMLVITIALIVYALTLALDTPALASEATGPVGVSTETMLVGQCALAALSTLAALLGASRARHAALLADCEATATTPRSR